MDDLAAELDKHHISRLMAKIIAMGFQTFITSSGHHFGDNVQDGMVFHVEQGKFVKMV
jgi:recombinational DNA repair ATPase RecF